MLLVGSNSESISLKREIFEKNGGYINSLDQHEESNFKSMMMISSTDLAIEFVGFTFGEGSRFPINMRPLKPRPTLRAFAS